jgi:NhaA family Na+:H+ antiporter
LGANRLGVKNPVFYAIVGILGIWTGFFLSGVHATIAGVITAVAIPAKVDFSETQFIGRIRNLISNFESTDFTDSVFVKKDQFEVVKVIRKATSKAVPPLQVIEKALQPFVNFLVLTLFAFSNTGLTIEPENLKLLVEPLSLGIIIGLVVGKVVGISLTARMATGLKIAKLPAGVRWPQIYGASAFAGIGFTMSIFISELVFDNETYIYQSKLAILVAFVLAVALGLAIFGLLVKPKDEMAA